MKKYLLSRNIVVMLVFFPAALLFLPVLHYSLNTPFGLVDDYINSMGSGRILDTQGHFLEWFNYNFLTISDRIRWRPFWDLYWGLSWSILGPNAWLHHLLRWIIHFVSVVIFVVAFLNIISAYMKNCQLSLSTRILPVVFLIYFWIFFPNQPAARISTAEISSIFFLSIITLMISVILSRKTNRSAIFINSIFYLAYIGLIFSKETNIAAALWILVFYYVVLLRDSKIRSDNSNQYANPFLDKNFQKKSFYGIPLILMFTYSFVMIYTASSSEYSLWDQYQTPLINLDLVDRNFEYLRESLFLKDTSLVITVAMVLMSVFLLSVITFRVVKRKLNNETIFVLFLIGLFVSQFLVLIVSPLQILRYWYILIPVFSVLLAFSIKFIFDFFMAYHHESKIFTVSIIFSIIGFISYFVGCNYYNFLTQTIIQHCRTTGEQSLLAEITRIIDHENYVVVNNSQSEEASSIILYYKRYLLRNYKGQSRDVFSYLPSSKRQPYYLVSKNSVASSESTANVHFLVEFECLPFSYFSDRYWLMKYAYEVSRTLQWSEKPYYQIDAGAWPPENWTIRYYDGVEH